MKVIYYIFNDERIRGCVDSYRLLFTVSVFVSNIKYDKIFDRDCLRDYLYCKWYIIFLTWKFQEIYLPLLSLKLCLWSSTHVAVWWNGLLFEVWNYNILAVSGLGFSQTIFFCQLRKY